MTTPTKTPYDPDADEQRNPVSHPHQNNIDSDFNDIVDNSLSDVDSTGNEIIRQQEEGGGESETTPEVAAEEAQLYREEGEGSEQGPKGKSSSLRGRLAGKKKLWLLVGGGGGGIVVIVFLVFILLFSSLKLPNLMENIVMFQFARVSRQFAKAGEKLTTESFAKRAIRNLNDTKLGGKVNDLHSKISGLKEDTRAKVDRIPGVSNVVDLNNKYNYRKFSSNLKTSGIEFSTDPRGRPTVIVSGAAAERAGIGTTTFLTEAPEKSFGRFIPVYSSFLKAQAAKKSISSGELGRIISDTIISEGRLKETPQVVRGWGMNQLLKGIGMTRLGLKIADFKNARTEAKQNIEIDKQQRGIVQPKEGHVTSVVSAIDERSQEAVRQQQIAGDAALASPEENAKIRENGTGIPAKPAESIKLSLSGSVLTNKATGLLSGGVYQLAFLACVFYDAANANSGSQSIDSNNTSNQKTFVTYAALADTQKRGVTNNDDVAAFDNMITAANNKIGNDTESTIPIQRAGGDAYDTSGNFPAQASPFGFQHAQSEFSLIYDLASSISGACPGITSTEGLIGSVAINVISSLGASGAKAFADESVDVATKSAINLVIKGFTSQFSKNFGRQAIKEGGKSLVARNLVTKPSLLLGGFYANAKIVAGVEALGAMEGASHAPGVLHNGFETGSNLVDQIDAGADSLSNEQNRQMMMGRPLNKDEVCASQAADVAFIQDNFKSKPAMQRYFATSTSQSLLSRSVINIGSDLNGPVSKPLVGLATAFARPDALFSSLLKPFGNKVMAAAEGNCDSSTAHHGNIQFGYSEDELNQIDSNISYNPDENLAILSESGQAEAIAKKYAACFGLKVGDEDTLEQDPDASIGHMQMSSSDDSDILSKAGKEYFIVRDVNGNVVDASNALCSPQFLGIDSKDPQFIGLDIASDSPNKNDLVFRWRLAVLYQNVQNQLSSIANAPAGSN